MPSEAIGKRLLELFPGHKESVFFETYKQVAETGETRIFEEMYQGETIGKPTYFRIVVVRTDRILQYSVRTSQIASRLEEELRKSRDELQDRVEERTGQLQQAYEELQ